MQSPTTPKDQKGETANISPKSSATVQQPSAVTTTLGWAMEWVQSRRDGRIQPIKAIQSAFFLQICKKIGGFLEKILLLTKADVLISLLLTRYFS